MSKGYEQRKKSNEKYLAKLDEIKVRVPKGKKDIIKEHASTKNESINAFINRAINQTMQSDKEG